MPEVSTLEPDHSLIMAAGLQEALLQAAPGSAAATAEGGGAALALC